MIISRKTFFSTLSVFFFLSGIAGLIYESIWSHYLKLYVGHAAYAQTLVLVIYMGGMAAGSWLASSFTKKINHLLPAYALAEIIIGLTACVFHPIFTNYISISYDQVIPALGSSLLISLYKWFTVPLLILPQTILLGATFPLMSSGIIRVYKDTPGHTFSILYFVNSLGGAFGVLLSGFFLIEKLTFSGTVVFAGVLDIIIGVGVLLVCLFNRSEKKQHSKTGEINEVSQKTIKLPVEAWVLLAASAGTAVASFIYEVGWIRMLSLVLGSSTHSFELMLSAFILGLAIGGFWIKNKLDTLRNPMATLATIQVVMGVLAAGSLIFYSKLFYLMKFILESLGRTDQGYIMFHLYSHSLCLLLMLPATIAAGMTLPLITWYLYKKDCDESVVGKVYASNTVGSIIGVLAAIHLILPLTGLKCLLVIGGSIDMFIGIFLLYYFREQTSKKLIATLALCTFAGIMVPVAIVKLDPILLSSGVYRFGRINTDLKNIFYKDGKTSSVSLSTRVGCYTLANNGKPDASVGIDSNRVSPDEHTQILLAAYPLAYSEKCENVGVIGLGSGMTASMFLESEKVRSLDVIEIEPFVIKAAEMIGPKVSKVFKDSRSQIHCDDARTFFSANKLKYDMIVSEPSNPWVSGVSSLFSVEFFRLISRHLTSEGMFVQWLHTYEMEPDLIASVLASLGNAFKDYKVFESGSDLIILASNKPIRSTPDNHIFTIKSFSRLLTAIDIDRPFDLQVKYIGSKKTLACLADMFDIPLNSDYNPILDLRAEKARFKYTNADDISRIGRFIIPICKILEGDEISDGWDGVKRKDYAENPNAQNMSAYNDAWQIWYYISEMGKGNESGADTIIAKRLVLKVTQLRMVANDKSIASQSVWPRYAIDLVKLTMPFLPTEKMLDVWAYIGKEGENVTMRQASKDFLEILKDITTGDYEKAFQLSALRMKTYDNRNDEFMKTYVAAYFLSAIKLKRFNEIQLLWNSLENLKYDMNLMMLYNYAYYNIK